MVKSKPSPTKSTMKATETRLRSPMKTAAKPVVSTRAEINETKVKTTPLVERKAIHKRTATSKKERPSDRPIPLDTLFSSSNRKTGSPVTPIVVRALMSASSPSIAASSAVMAAFAGWIAVKSKTGVA